MGTAANVEQQAGGPTRLATASVHGNPRGIAATPGGKPGQGAQIRLGIVFRDLKFRHQGAGIGKRLTGCEPRRRSPGIDGGQGQVPVLSTQKRARPSRQIAVRLSPIQPVRREMR